MFRVFAQLPQQHWFYKPILGWQQIQICPISGFPASPDCPKSDSVDVPAGPLQLEPCPFHRKIFTDATGKWRVHATCSKTLVPKSVFLLPSDQQFYFHSFINDATVTPPWHPTCAMGTSDQDAPLVVYPAANAQIYLPIDLDSKQNPCIFQATHRRDQEELFWHLDGKYLGKTTKPHTMKVLADSGAHRLTVVDEEGNQTLRKFVFLRKAL
jgi:penicillin-binding protein 1C